MNNRHYEKWVKSLPCAITGDDTTTDCHHLKGAKAGGNIKTSSFLCIPLSRKQHNALHDRGPIAWEMERGVTQYELAAKTMLRAIYEGVLVIDVEKTK